MWALLALYQALRIVMVEAAESLPDPDPDRCSFTVALQTARDQVVQATGIVPDEPGPLGLIGRRVLDRLLAPRRHRTGTRKVKSPMSRYSERRDDGRPDRSRIVTHLTVTVLEPGPQQPSLPTASRDDRHTAQPSADGIALSPCCRTTRPAGGDPRRSLPTSATSRCTPCIGGSPDQPQRLSRGDPLHQHHGAACQERFRCVDHHVAVDTEWAEPLPRRPRTFGRAWSR